MLDAADTTALAAALAPWGGLPAADLPPFAALFTAEDLPRGAALVVPGSGRHRMALVLSGVLAITYPEADGTQATKAFITPGLIAGSISAVITGVDPHYGITALGRARVLAADPAAWRALIPTRPAYERLARLHAEWLLLRKEDRERDFLSGTAADRWRRLCTEEPELVAQVPARHLASFLGITPVQLSRIRARERAAPG